MLNTCGNNTNSSPSAPAHFLSVSDKKCAGAEGEELVLERFRNSHFTDRITYRQSVKLIRNLEFRASLRSTLRLRMAYTMETKNGGMIDFELVSPTSGELRKLRSVSRY